MKWCQSTCPKPPIVRKCCFVVPIRKGVIVFGYVNLVLTLLAFPFFLFMLVEELTKDGDTDELPPRMDPIVHLPLTLAFLLTDVVMYIVLLIGAHKIMVWNERYECDDLNIEYKGQKITQVDNTKFLGLFLDTNMNWRHQINNRKQGMLKSYLYFGLVFQVVTLCVDLVFLDIEEYLENAVYFFFLGLNLYLLFLVYNTVRAIEEGAVQYVAHQDLRQLIM